MMGLCDEDCQVGFEMGCDKSTPYFDALTFSRIRVLYPACLLRVEYFKASIYSYLQSALLVNKILHHFGGPFLSTLAPISFGALHLKQISLSGVDGKVDSVSKSSADL